ncbi:unnamed protein product [Ranitomeya imitator]|uniref:TNF family profile domain-containing protein n=1 Tax=Ranitomeya imitator TaxID=111125 RepID=A0ABN9LAF1_9NEOB|nr:unnamed protein product [Ranitomeya imitator]
MDLLINTFFPSSVASDSQDCTEISWKVSLQEGKSLESEGKSVQVKHSGIYSIYSQVFYTDTTYTMGHIVLQQTDGDSKGSNILLRCVQSMPGDKSLAFNTCYTSATLQRYRQRSGSLQRRCLVAGELSHRPLSSDQRCRCFQAGQRTVNHFGNTTEKRQSGCQQSSHISWCCEIIAVPADCHRIAKLQPTGNYL